MCVEEVASAPRLVIKVPLLFFFSFFFRGWTRHIYIFCGAENCNQGTKAAKEPLFFTEMRHFCFCAQMNHKWRQCNITHEADIFFWCKSGAESRIIEELFVLLSDWRGRGKRQIEEPDEKLERGGAALYVDEVGNHLISINQKSWSFHSLTCPFHVLKK